MPAPRKIEAAPAVMLLEADDRRFKDLRARACLRGVEVYVLDDDCGRPCFIATKWACTAHFSNLDDLAAWVQKVDGKTE
jgi:hypothetical protein